ncbi:MAG: hypothetical protein WDN01_07395 [Rhizomicrobium sp.]
MDEPYFSASIDNSTSLCLSPLSDRGAAATSLDPNHAEAYFLYERTQTDGDPEISVIAQVSTSDAALRPSKLLNLE